jgi:hypothetical protein
VQSKNNEGQYIRAIQEEGIGSVQYEDVFQSIADAIRAVDTMVAEKYGTAIEVVEQEADPDADEETDDKDDIPF